MNVVGDMSLRDTMCTGGTNPSHDGSKITKEITIIGRQSPTGEGELACTIMGKEGVGVLQECDQYEPVVDPGKACIGRKPRFGGADSTYQR